MASGEGIQGGIIHILFFLDSRSRIKYGTGFVGKTKNSSWLPTFVGMVPKSRSLGFI